MRATAHQLAKQPSRQKRTRDSTMTFVTEMCALVKNKLGGVVLQPKGLTQGGGSKTSSRWFGDLGLAVANKRLSYFHFNSTPFLPLVVYVASGGSEH